MNRDVDSAVEDIAWRNSPERAAAHRRAGQFVALFVVAVVAVGVAVFFYNLLVGCGSGCPAGQSTKRGVGAAALGVVFFGLGLGIFVGELETEFRRQFNQRRLVESSKSALEEADEAVFRHRSQTASGEQSDSNEEIAQDIPSEQSELELGSLWRATHARLNLYHEIVTQQARVSFRQAQIAMVVGFLVLATASIVAALAPNTTGSVVAGTVGLGAGALSGYISRTLIRSQELSSNQLRQYFNQPLNFSKYLVAERLLATTSKETREKGILSIVAGISGSEPDDLSLGDRSPLDESNRSALSE